MKVKTEKDLWLFVLIIAVFAVCVVVLQHTVLREFATELVPSLAVGVASAIPVAYTVGRKFQKLNELYEERERLISYDRLTKVLSREGFFSRLERTVADNGVALMIDLDHFKSINDTHGHLVGDKVLSHVAGIIAQNVRPQDFVGRFGGEEFVVFLVGASVEDARLIGERLRQEVEGTMLAHEEAILRSTVSIGAAPLPEDADFYEAMRRADEALYKAKKSGRNMLRLHTTIEAA